MYEQALYGLHSANPRALLAGEGGEVYVAGYSRIPYDEVTESGGDWRAWVARLDATGALLGQTYLGSGYGNQYANALARDSRGNIYVAGDNENIDVFPPLAPLAEDYRGGGYEITSIGFVAQLSAALDLRYASQIAGATAYSIVVDSAGRVFIPTYRSYQSGVLVSIAPNGTAWGPEVQLGGALLGADAAAIDAAGNISLASYGVFARVSTATPDVPNHTSSYYIQTIDPQVSRYMGCTARQRGEQGIAILFFGRPIKRGALYGSSLKPEPGRRGVPDFVSMEQIATIVQAFADGYSRFGLCQREFKLDVAEREVTPRQLVIAVATSNSSLNDEKDPNPDLTFDHGQAWAQMVLDLNTYVDQMHSSGVSIAGAYDAEPRWTAKQAIRDAQGNIVRSGEERTLDWARGFSSLDTVIVEEQALSRGLVYYNMGSLDGGIRDSSWRGRPDSNFNFTFELSKGITGSRALPQIYNAAFAKEWYQFRRYSRIERKRPVELAGVLTQVGSSGADFSDLRPWQEVEIDLNFEAGARRNLTPTQAWQAMYDALHRTLIIPSTLKSNFGAPLPDSFLLPPGAEEDFVPNNQTGCAVDYISYNGRRYTQAGGLPQPNNRISRTSCLSTGTIFPVDSTFSQRFTFPADVLTVYNQATRQPLPWATDIGWGRTRVP